MTGPFSVRSSRRHPVVAVGAGPANLSLAALAEKTVLARLPVFEKRPGPAWHDELLLPGVRLQTSWVKDLVSLADPTSPLSFLNYKVTTGRIYAFLNAQFDTIPRLEYARYLAWASRQLNISYGAAVDRVAFDGAFQLFSGGELVAEADHVVFGLGTTPFIPPCFEGLPVERVMLAEKLNGNLPGMRDRSAPVVVIGGGQTGAEAVLMLYRAGFTDIRWIGRLHWFAPLDDSPSANDFYRPQYVSHFYDLPDQARRRLAREQTLTSDGVSMASLREIYQVNYEEELHTGRRPVTLLPGRDVVAARSHGDTIRLDCRLNVGTEESHDIRYAVLATGRRSAPLPIDDGLADLLEVDEHGEPLIAQDYSLRWKHAGEHNIYVQNRGRFSHGLVDPNLSLLAVRSATILNSLAGRELYPVRDEQCDTVWRAKDAEPAADEVDERWVA